MTSPTVVELCAGAGGQALGLERAGFHPLALVEIDRYCCATLLANRPEWPVLEQDLNCFDGSPYRGVDLLAGGLPCPPFSVAGRRLGEGDHRNLFPAMLRLTKQMLPMAIMIENVRGLLTAQFEDYRQRILSELTDLGYAGEWKPLNACDFGVPQYRPRAVLVAFRNGLKEHFDWPKPVDRKPPTVGENLEDLMASRGWHGASDWREKASSIAPTVVGGSLKHGGPDLGPTRAKRVWSTLGVDGLGIADEPPGEDFAGTPRLTVRMVARLQGFPDSWRIVGGKTAAYRQIGNAFPPPVAEAVAQRIRLCLSAIRPALSAD